MSVFKLGLTGSIGTGKTTTAALFAKHGCPVWSADDAVHRLYAVGGCGAALLAGLVPLALKDGIVDRGLLRRPSLKIDHFYPRSKHLCTRWSPKIALHF